MFWLFRSTLLLQLCWEILLARASSFTAAFQSRYSKANKYNDSLRLRPGGSSRIRHASSEIISDPTTVLSTDQWNTIDDLVRQRARARWEGDFETADKLRLEILDTVPETTLSVSITDLSRNDGGGSTWKLLRSIPTNHPSKQQEPTVLQLAHQALGLAILSSEKGIPVDQEKLNNLVEKVQDRLKLPSVTATELSGRKAADAAFWLAMAGGINSSDEGSILYTLANIVSSELERFGSRPSCRSKDILQILERFAAAGLERHEPLETAAYQALQYKPDYNHLNSNLLDFHSDRCLMLLWKFSTRQRKQRAFLAMARNHWLKNQNEEEPQQEEEERKQTEGSTTASSFDNWSKVFKDPMKPLVIDLGCGMGVSLLGLAKQDDNKQESPLLVNDWNDYNFAGVDLSGLAIAYANSIASTWNLKHKLHFCRDNAEDFIKRRLVYYPGPIALCLVQFPTPYRLSKAHDDDSGNIQLPSSATDKNFMVSQRLLQSIHGVLDQKKGKLIIQSNCEDVAVWIRNLALSCHFHSGEEDFELPSYEEEKEYASVKQSLTKRTVDWIAIEGNDLERATGRKWCSGPILPRRGRTETEVACLKNGTPVHRCVLAVKS